MRRRVDTSHPMQAPLRAEMRRAIRENWKVFVGLAALVLGMAAVLVGVEVLSNGWTFMAGLFAGLIVAYVIQLRWVFLSMTGFQARREGIAAEIDTRRILHRLGPGWTVVSNVWFDTFDIDHVVIGPGRVYAIETKWSGMAHDARVRQRLAGVAEHRAAALRRALAERDVDVNVIPMLVLHGRRRGALSEPELRRRTRVVAASEWRHWLQRMRDAASPTPDDALVREVVEELATAGHAQR